MLNVFLYQLLKNAKNTTYIENVSSFLAACSRMVLLYLSKFLPVRNRQKFAYKSTC